MNAITTEHVTDFWPPLDAIRVGPVETNHGTVYRYMVGRYLSEHEYHNAASAEHDAKRRQRITALGTIEPMGVE